MLTEAMMDSFPVCAVCDIENNKIWIACCDYETCSAEDIKSIVTKEQFSSMEYRLGDDQ